MIADCPMAVRTRDRFCVMIASLIACIWLASGRAFAAGPEGPKTPIPAPSILRVSLNEALALFLRQNLDLIMTGFGIDYARGQQITARLFPNPVFSLGTVASFTQGRTLTNSAQIYPN